MYSSLDPKQKYLVLNSITISPQENKCLIKLYQPLVSGIGLSLYQSLLVDFNPYQTLTTAKQITYLQESLDVSLPDLLRALHKLEATGLVETYISQSLQQKTLAFKLHPVSSPAAFFGTPLLASLLREKIGGVRFQQLSHTFAQEKKLDNKQLRSLKNVSATFFEVFNLPEQEAITPSKEVQEAAQANRSQEVAAAKINPKQSVDWDFLKAQFAIYQIPPSEIDNNKTAIAGLMTTYALSEQDFVDEAIPSLHGNYQLNMKQIAALFAENIKADRSRQEVQKHYRRQRAQQVIGSLSLADNQLIKLANEMAPIDFLYHAKEKKGGFVTPYEKNLVNNLHNRYGFPQDVLNVLINTCLSYSSVFSSKLAYQIGNDWLQHKITTAAAAISYQKKRQEYGKRRQYQQHNKVVEQGTDWQHKKANTNVQMSDEEMDRIFTNLGEEQKKD